MFVPKTASSLRNPRRRQRTSSGESTKQHRAKRQRSVQEDAEQFGDDGIESDGRRESSGFQPPGATDQAKSEISEEAGPQKQIAIRGPKKFEKQGGYNDIDGAVVLSNTNLYTVSQLPALPDKIRGLQSEPFKCFFGASHGYALVLTESHAFIWDYSIPASSPSPADIFTLSVPEPCRGTNASAPLGILLSTPTFGPPGLMIIMPSTGNIFYRETVSGATSLGLSSNRQNGIQGSISGLLPGENVTDVMNGEPSGVIAMLSSGRVAHITIRSSQGKPTVMSSFLRTSASGSSNGLLGGIKNVLGGGFWRREIAAARPGKSHQRGQRDIIIVTTNGLVEVWDTHWNNGSMLKKQLYIGQCLSESLGPVYADETGGSDIKIIDFVFAGDDHLHESHCSEAESCPLYFVVGSPRRSSSMRLWVAQVVLSDEVRVSFIRSIDLHHIRPNLSELRPRLFVPRPGDAGFIILGQTIIILSLAPFEEPPTSQLLRVHQRRFLYDSIDFRSGMEHEILGCGFEEPTPHSRFAACLVMVRGFGVIRVTALPRLSAQSHVDDAHVTTAKHKLEQAVFYGSMRENPLDLSSKGGLQFPPEELEQAALEICSELLRSHSKFIPTSGISLDQNLRSRAKALDSLASLLIHHGLPLNGLIWWELLWSAEKIAAQRAMWKIEQEAKSKASTEPTFLSRVIEMMSEKFRTKFQQQDHENDHVRHWFLHDTYRVEHIIPWIFHAIKHQNGQPRAGRKMAEQVLEASDFSLAVLETAFRFRDEHASPYGLSEEFLEDGVLVNGYEGLPEIWTSHNMAYIETGHLLDLELGSCMAWTQQRMTVGDAPEGHIVRQIAKSCARQLRVLGQMHSERMRWLSAQGNPMLTDEVIATEQSHVKQRRWQLFKLAGVGQLDDAVSLAEKSRDMSALVELIIELQDQSNCQLFAEVSSGHGPDAIENETGDLGKKISHYFEKFGEPWANAFFSRQISMGQSGVLFAMRKFQPFVTRFLRKGPICPRLSWINDVVGENDHATASYCLENLAIESESDLWSHRVELSMAKLAKLAALEHTGSTDDSNSQNGIKRLDDYAEIGNIQEVVHAHVAPGLQGAIDQKAEIDLASEQFGKHIAEERPSLHEVLVSALTKVITRQIIGLGLLVDLLTLLDTAQIPGYSHGELSGKEFCLALRAIRLRCHAQGNQLYTAALQKLVWRRCMIKNDWEATGNIAESFNNVSRSVAQDSALFSTLFFCLKEQHEDVSCPSLYVPLSPMDVLLSESDSILLSSRFRPEQRARITRDLEKENEILCRYLEAGNLEFWFKNLLSSAEMAIV